MAPLHPQSMWGSGCLTIPQQPARHSRNVFLSGQVAPSYLHDHAASGGLGPPGKVALRNYRTYERPCTLNITNITCIYIYIYSRLQRIVAGNLCLVDSTMFDYAREQIHLCANACSVPKWKVIRISAGLDHQFGPKTYDYS